MGDTGPPQASWSEREELTCPFCQHVTHWEKWAFVNAAERPDLFRQVQDGTIRQVSCSGCGHDFWPGRPLMIYNPTGFPRAAVVTPDEAGADFALLAQALQLAMGNDWRGDDVIYCVYWPIMRMVFRRDIRADLTRILVRPREPPGEQHYFDFLEQVRRSEHRPAS
jgi:hypothetical protein